MEKHELKLIILQTPAEPVPLPRVPSSQLLYLYLFKTLHLIMAWLCPVGISL